MCACAVEPASATLNLSQSVKSPIANALTSSKAGALDYQQPSRLQVTPKISPPTNCLDPILFVQPKLQKKRSNDIQTDIPNTNALTPFVGTQHTSGKIVKNLKGSTVSTPRVPNTKTHSTRPNFLCQIPSLRDLLLPLLYLTMALSFLPVPCACVKVKDFFPFGNSAGDNITEKEDDGGSGKINLTVAFPFFGSKYDQLYVNNNGIISFLNELRSYSPMKFPLSSPTPLIAPYWADVDISDEDSGLVWFRQTTDPQVLVQANKELLTHRFSNRKFQAAWVFLVTWDEVGFYGPVGEGKTKRNTFQAVLVVDDTGERSFVIFNYARLDWTTGSNSLGDENTGLGGTPAQAGFNAGDMEHFYEIEDSRKAAIINLTQTSNVDVPGKWIFRVDTPEIEETCPVTGSSKLTVSPAAMSQLGGEIITLEGSCLAEDDIVNGTVQPSGEHLCCRILEKTKIRCLTPPVFDTGQRQIKLSVMIGREVQVYTAQILVKNLMDMKPLLKRDNLDLWRAGDNRELSVSWNSAEADVMFQQASGHRVEFLEYRVLGGKASLVTLWTKDFHHDLHNSYRLQMPKSFSRTRMSVAVVRVTALIDICNGFGPSIFSDVFPVRSLTASDANSQCSAWLASEADLSPLKHSGDTRCPCTLGQAEGDTAQFTRDPFCRRDSTSALNCRYRLGEAVECILPNRVSSTSSPFTCCYDKSGELLNARVAGGTGGGTLQRYSYRKSSVSFSSGSDTSSGANSGGSSSSDNSGGGSGNIHHSSNGVGTTNVTPNNNNVFQSGGTNSSNSGRGNNLDYSSVAGFNSDSDNSSLPDVEYNSENRTVIDSGLSVHGSHSNHSDNNSSLSRGSNSSHVTAGVGDAFHNNSYHNNSNNSDITSATPNPSSSEHSRRRRRNNSQSSSFPTATSGRRNRSHRTNGDSNGYGRTNNNSSSVDYMEGSSSGSSNISNNGNTKSSSNIRDSNNNGTYNSSILNNVDSSNSNNSYYGNTNSSNSVSQNSSNFNYNTSSIDTNAPIAARQSSHLADPATPFVPYFSHMVEDIAPRLHCCQYSDNQTLCDQFLRYRPPVTCQKYQAPSAAQAAGDPHMETLDGHAYTFNGLGTFTLMRVKDTEAIVQVKTARARNTRGQFENATVFTGLAMRGNGTNSPVLELALTGDNSTLYQIFVNGQLHEESRVTPLESAGGGDGSGTSGNDSLSGQAETELPVVLSWQAGDISVVESRLTNQRPEVMIVLDDLGISLLVEVMEELINIIAVASPQLKGKLEGLLGNYNGDGQDDFLSRDGVVVSPSASMKVIHYEFGMSWEVQQNESLFSQPGSTNFLAGAATHVFDETDEEKEFTPLFIDEMELSKSRRRRSAADLDTAICEGNTQCIFDLQVTKNENIALSTLKFNKRFEELKSEIKPVVRCPYPDDIPNGNRTFTGLKENDTVTFTCYHGYQMATGGSTRVLMCLNTSEWDSEQPTCVSVFDTGEDFPIVFVAIGAAAGAFLLVFLLALLIRVAHQRKTRPWRKKSDSSNSSSMDYDQAIELPTLFPISDIPSPVFENPLFLQRLQQLNEKGSFQIPRPTYVDPNIYTEFF